MQIIKRNGARVEYSSDKVVASIASVLRVNGETDFDLAVTIENEVYVKLLATKKECSVEEISDITQRKLFEYGLIDAGMEFLEYRNTKTTERKYRKRYKFLSDAFLGRYDFLLSLMLAP